MKKIFNSNFESVGALVEGFVQASNLHSGMKKSTLFKFWGKIAGKKFEDKSKPVGITNKNILYIACANSFVTSELTMFKQDIFRKVQQYAKPLDIEIVDIIFSHKIWKNETNDSDFYTPDIKDPTKPDLSGFNPDDTELDDEEIESIKKSVETNTFASQEQRDKMFKAIINDLKIQKYLKNKKL